jgi:hypothetical protein
MEEKKSQLAGIIATYLLEIEKGDNCLFRLTEPHICAQFGRVD